MDDKFTPVMVMPERAEGMIRASMAMLEKSVADGIDFQPTVGVFRDGASTPVAVCVGFDKPGYRGIDLLFDGMGLLACGLDGDMLVLVFDTWGTEGEVNSITGQPWVHGEMQAVMEAGNPGGAVHEVLNVIVSFPDGGIAAQDHRYRRVDGALEWLPRGEGDGVTGLGGRFTAQMVDVWKTERLVVDHPFERVLADAMVFETLKRMGLAVIIAGSMS
jgi:hypothetical protein